MERIWRYSADVPRLNRCEDVSRYDADAIYAEINRLAGAESWRALFDSAAGWRQTSESLDELRDTVERVSTALADAWEGPDAAAAQAALRLVHSSAERLAESSYQAYHFTEGAAESLHQAVTSFPSRDRGWFESAGIGVGAANGLLSVEAGQQAGRVVDGLFSRDDPDEAPRAALAELNARYQLDSTRLPPQVGVELPQLDRFHTAAETVAPVAGSGAVLPGAVPAGTAPGPGAGAVGTPTSGAATGGSGDSRIGLTGGLAGATTAGSGLPAGAAAGVGPGSSTVVAAGGPGVGVGAGGLGAGGLGAGGLGAVGLGATVGAAAGLGSRTGPGGGLSSGSRPLTGATPGGRSGPPTVVRPGLTAYAPATGSTAGAPGGRAGGGAAGAGAGGGRPGGAVLPGPARPAGQPAQDDDDRRTWLMEDEDPWGGATEAAPGVVR